MQGFLLKTEDFPVVRAEYEAKCQNLLRGGAEPGVLCGLCAHEELYSATFLWLLFSTATN